MRDSVTAKTLTPLPELLRKVTNEVDGFSDEAKRQFFAVIEKVPMAFQKANAIFSTPERRTPGSGGMFSIFVSDLCKGCAACVTACGDHQALRMVQETEDVNAEHETGTAFLNLLPDTSQKYLGLYNDAHPEDSKTAALRNLLMVRRNYDALVSGDGACAGCGEKSVLKAITSVTEAYMRPLYHAKAERFRAKAERPRKDRRAETRRTQGPKPARVRPVAPGDRPPGDGPRRRGRKGHQGAHRRAWRDHGRRSRPRHRHRAAARSVQSHESPGHRWPPRQRHVRDGHGRAHRLQYGVRLDAVQQPAPVSVDELPLPGRHHRGMAAGRKLHRGSRSPVRRSRTAGRYPAAADGKRHQRRASTTNTRISPTR